MKFSVNVAVDVLSTTVEQPWSVAPPDGRKFFENFQNFTKNRFFVRF
jgi:hypothetical protein